MVLGISAVSVFTSPFSFIILLIWVFSLFFLMNRPKGLSIFYLLKESAFSFIDLCYHFLQFFFMYFWSDLYDFFPSANFRGYFCSSFSNCLQCKVRLFFWDFLFVCFGRIVLLRTSLLQLILLSPIGFGSSCFPFHLFLGIF